MTPQDYWAQNVRKVIFLVVFQAILRNFELVDCFPNPVQGYKKCGRVHLTVSSLKETYLEMNWITKCDKARDVKPDFIALYGYNPKEKLDEPHLAMIRADFYNGFYKTKIKFRQPWLPGNWEYQENATGLIQGDTGPQCFPYWIASLKGNEILDVACLSIRPTWMNDIRDQLKSQRIGNTFIPGTHNSACFEGVPKFLAKYVLNQDRNIWTQLVFGIRYLDFRIGYYDGFYVNHDIIRLGKLIPMLREIRRFVEMAPTEVVIVDFHRFPYPTQFTAEIHRKLVDVIGQELGHLALPPGGLQAGKGPTFNEIWHQNKTLIICYGQREIAKEFNWLWNPLQQHWGNKKTSVELKQYVNATIRDHATIFNPMWALMAELTPQPIDYLFMLRANSLRAMADDVNKQLTVWFRDEWPKDVNVVATDFFLGNDLINVAIESNKYR